MSDAKPKFERKVLDDGTEVVTHIEEKEDEKTPKAKAKGDNA